VDVQYDKMNKSISLTSSDGVDFVQYHEDNMKVADSKVNDEVGPTRDNDQEL